MKQSLFTVAMMLLALVAKAQAPSGVEAVDLGLPSGTKWATMNVGATAVGERGNKYAFGEIETRPSYPVDYHVGYDDVHNSINPWYPALKKNITGSIYDVAHVRWGGKWRMPTKDEFDELKKYCSTEGATVNGVKGSVFKGPNGNSIFLPYGYNIAGLSHSGYWTSEPYYKKVYDGTKMYEYGSSHYIPFGGSWMGDSDYQCSWKLGLYVRPVLDETTRVEDIPLIDLDEAKGWEPVNQTGIIKLTKTFHHGWNTFVVPFSLSKDSKQLPLLFHSQSYRLYAFNGYSNGAFMFQKTGDNSVTANTPYLLWYDGPTEKVTVFLSHYYWFGYIELGTSSATPVKNVGAFDFTGFYGGITDLASDYLLNKRYFESGLSAEKLSPFQAYIRKNSSEETPSIVQISVDGATQDVRILLDENSTEEIYPSDGVDDIRVKRAFKDGEWSTVVLPFDMTKAQMTEVFGNGVQLARFIKYDTDEDVTAISVIFDDVDLSSEGFKANTPYIIRPTKDVSEILVSAVVEPNEDMAVTHYDEEISEDNWRYGYFRGTYHAQTPLWPETLFISDNCFWYSAGKTEMKAFRAYFWFKDVLSEIANAPSLLRMSFEGKTTKVNTLSHSKRPPKGIYDLQGRLAKTTRKGVYIINGKKCVVR